MTMETQVLMEAKGKLQNDSHIQTAQEETSSSVWNTNEEGYGAIGSHSEKDAVSDGTHTTVYTKVEGGEDLGMTSCDSSSQATKMSVTYYNLLRNNKPFRLYMLCYITSQIGEWFTYVAVIDLLEQIIGTTNQDSGRIYVSFLVAFRLLPILVLSPLGGVVADAYDRRTSMIILNLIAAILPLLFITALHFQSVSIIYIVLSLQGIVSAMYEPCQSAILPLMVPDSEEQQKATTLTGLAWSSMGALGSGLGGYVVTLVGVQGCFGEEPKKALVHF